MKTAVIYTGEARSFGKLLDNHWFHVLRKLPNPEFFVSVQDDAQAHSMFRLTEKYDPALVHIEIVQQPTLPEPPPDPPHLAGYATHAMPQSILRQLWALNRGWQFYKSHHPDRAHGCVVRIRPDSLFHRFEMPSLTPYTCYTPWWGRWGGVNDRLAVVDSVAAEWYFTTFSAKAWEKLGYPLHPETLIGERMREFRGLHQLSAEFSTLRVNGEVDKWVNSVTTIDVADYARSRP